MEFEVRAVGGIANCFVSLPLALIQSLQSARSGAGFVSQVLTLELRSQSSGHVWVVAWSGAASSSPSIEVAQQYADCISLIDRVTVQVRVVSNMSKATLVTIEPDSEDDWEVLELNAEIAEEAILNQVRIVHEAMRFPLWLHGRTIITFCVISTFPKKPVVQLVPGTEVAVAPKRRQKILGFSKSSQVQSSKEHRAKAQLRIQDLDRRLIYKSHFMGFELGVLPTSVAFVHPETAKDFSLHSLQLVAIFPRFSSKESFKYSETSSLKTWNSSTPKEANSRDITDKKDSFQAIARLLISDLVAKGHLMIADSVRRVLRVGLHSWVYLKQCDANLKGGFSSVSLSPCHFKTFEKDQNAAKSSLKALDSHKNFKRKNMLPKTRPISYIDVVDWSAHDKVVDVLNQESSSNGDLKASNHTNKEKGLRSLLRLWLLAQLDATASHAGVEVNSLVLGNQTLLHFEVKGLSSLANMEASSHGPLNTINKTTEIIYVLTIPEESLRGGKVDAFELASDERNRSNINLGAVECFEKLIWGDPVSFLSVKQMTSEGEIGLDTSSLSWMGASVSDITNRMLVLLSPTAGRWFSSYNLPLPGHVLICGPAGSGKTILTKAVAKSLQEHEDLFAHQVFISCSRLALEKAPEIRKLLSSYISEALAHAPSVVVFDDLDSIISASSDSEGSNSTASMIELTEFLIDVMDEYGEKRKSSCGVGPIAFIASVQALDKIPESLSSSGRFDFHVQLPAPAASERSAMLKHEIRRRFLECSDDILQDVASKCDGYDAYDLEILVDRAVHAAVARYLPSASAFNKQEKPMLNRDDFSRAMHEFMPVSMRDITKPATEGGRSGWDDVGGLTDVRNSIKEMIELPSKFPNIFAQAPMRLRSNVLLYGPPGCGKTHIVGAAAAACSLRFISIKGPELLNKYIGASEQAVRDIFSKAAAAAPCILFFDEFDSIAPKRGHDNTGVTDRVVNQFLTELDGVEVLTGVFVFAATSRPDLLDAALLRPGRLDRLLFCDFPSIQERLDILIVLSRKLPLAIDVDLHAIAKMTEGFSGADLQALLSDAQLAAVHELLGEAHTSEPAKKPVITNDLLQSTAFKAKPSVSEADKERLYGIYGQFLDSKRSVSAQSRDAKGKRATLA